MSGLYMIFVTFFAGMGADLGTGFAGMSAAAVISPMLITFLGMDPYMAVGIALSSDVLASAVSAYTYHKNKNLDIRNGLIMMASVLVFTVAGSYISSLLPSATVGSFSVFMTFLLGVKFIVRPVMTTKEDMQQVSPRKRIHLRIYRCRRRHDDAAHSDECPRLRAQDRGRHECFHYDIHSTDGRCLTFYDRRHA